MNSSTATQFGFAGQLVLLRPARDWHGANEGRALPVLSDASILEHESLGDRYWRMRVDAPHIASTAAPGQFAMLTVARQGEWEPALPRPMAIFASEAASGTVDFVYGVVGRGTRSLTRFGIGDRVTVVGPLGRGFVLSSDTRRLLLIGRGIGACSLTGLAREALCRGLEVSALDSARHAGALVGRATYTQLGVTSLLLVNDADGSSNAAEVRSLLFESLSDDPPDQIFVCGSRRLLEVAGDLARSWGASIQVSVEAHMACGLGYCHGCSSGVRAEANEAPLVCKDGPVFAWEPA